MILIHDGEQPVPLAADISELQECVLRNLPLQGQVILLGVLAWQGLGIIPEQLDRPEHREINRRSLGGIQHSMKRVRIYRSILG